MILEIFSKKYHLGQVSQYRWDTLHAFIRELFVPKILEIVIKCSAVEFSQKNHVLKNNVNLGWVHYKHLFGSPTLS